MCNSDISMLKFTFFNNFLSCIELDMSGAVVCCNCCCPCVCVSILFHREGFFRLQDVLDILEGTDQRCCVVSIIRNAAAKFPHLGI